MAQNVLAQDVLARVSWGGEETPLAASTPAAAAAYRRWASDGVNGPRLRPALTLLRRLAQACKAAAAGDAPEMLRLDRLDPENRALIEERLGVGGMLWRVGADFEARETIFSGVWLVSGPDGGHLEVGAAPGPVRDGGGFAATRRAQGLAAKSGPRVTAAPAQVTEIMAKASAWRWGDPSHVANLTRGAHSTEDLDHFDRALGRGAATLVAHGYGCDCVVEATATPLVWRARFFNSMGALVLDALEVADIPEAGRATPDDFEESAARIDQMLVFSR